MITIRPFQESDWAATWQIMKPVFRAGETYAFSPNITKEEAYQAWIDLPSATFVAIKDNQIVGTYYIKPNQPTLGAHICNCGYIVAENVRGKGIASQMCQHSQREAVSRGFQGMQYNLVVATNESAIRLWKKQGFEIVGKLPKAFLHRNFGFVDAFILFKELP